MELVMKKIVLIVLLMVALFSCATEIDEPTSVNEKYMTYCDITILTGVSFIDTADVWHTLDLSHIIGRQSLIELELIHEGGDITEYMSMSFRKDALHNIYSTSAFYETYKGTVLFSTDANGRIQWRADWAADAGRKIYFKVKLKMY
jgi:hypothetical protein